MESASIRGQTSPRPAITASRWFALIGWILIGTTLSGVVFTSLPVRIIRPEWQLQVISAILAGTTSLLLGSLLVCGAYLLNPRNAKLQQRSDFLKRVSGWFAVLLLLIIPFQFYAGHRASGVVQAEENESIQLVKRIIRGVTASNDEAELRSFLASLPSPPPVPARFDAPFPEIKQRLLTNFNSRLNAANYQAGVLRTQRLEKFVAEASRNSVQAFLMAIAFTGIAEQFGPLFGFFQRLGLFRYRD